MPLLVEMATILGLAWPRPPSRQTVRTMKSFSKTMTSDFKRCRKWPKVLKRARREQFQANLLLVLEFQEG